MSEHKPRWRIYYDDREPYSNEDGPPELAPSVGAQAIVQMEPGRIVMTERPNVLYGGMPGPLHDEINPARKDFYCYNFANQSDLWTITDYIGFLDYLQMLGWRKVVFGRSIEIPKYNEIINRAMRDPDFLNR